jgi:phosphatidylethanolamine-binding protein (PEBP) family uncharacterized protein
MVALAGRGTGDCANDGRSAHILRAMHRFAARVLSVAALAVLVTTSLAAQPAPVTLTVTSPTLIAGQPIPKQHTADGENTSPAFAWTSAPAATKSFALICDDPDVPMPQPFVHWVIYNIPATAKGLPANIPIDPAAAMPAEIAGAIQGPSGFRLPAGLNKAQLVDAMAGHIVGKGELVATYERKPPAPVR